MKEVQTDIGRRAERRAETFLNAQGLLTVARNIRCRHGELD
ncbi:MAG: YraN family protein, partial [Luminiphilus sp.]